jgi:DNA (cytosine-5)-methyltransferase 1
VTRIGSLFSGYGGLEQGVQSVLGGTVAWHSDIDPGACKILAHRYPDVPNLGDITAVDWSQVEPVDVITGGFPCQDVSAAGLRKGMRPDTRSGLFTHFAYAIDQLRPSLVVIENVRGLLSADAHHPAHDDLEPCPWCMGDGEQRPLRALGAVLGQLADLGYDASWQGLRASDVGAPHGRFRVFVIAWPAADADGAGRVQHGRPVAVRSEQPAAECRSVAAHPAGDGWHERRTEPAGIVGGFDAAVGSASAAAHSISLRGKRRRGYGDVAGSPRSSEGHQGQRERHGDAVDDRGSVAWGGYESAIRRWERVTRPAPAPTQLSAKGSSRLSPRFVEWLMGLPAGWVTDVPGLTRNEQLKALGNGVVSQQAAEALRLLLPDVEAIAA